MTFVCFLHRYIFIAFIETDTLAFFFMYILCVRLRCQFYYEPVDIKPLTTTLSA